MEKRRSKRHARRLKVRFGDATVAGFPYSGFTNDVSSTGLFIVAGHSLTPGTRVHAEVTLPGERPLYIEAVVTRQAVVPPELRQVVRSGFGARFLTGVELMAELVPALAAPKKDDPFLLTYADAEALRGAMERELKRGGVFLWSPKAVPQNTIVTLVFDLKFADKQLAFEARVVHTTPANDGRFGVALMFVDAGAAVTSLSSTLGP